MGIIQFVDFLLLSFLIRNTQQETPKHESSADVFSLPETHVVFGASVA